MASRRLGLLTGVVILTFASICIGIWFVLTSNRTATYPSYGWHIVGRVCDNASNSLPGVNVNAEGVTRITFSNHVLGTDEQDFRRETVTDEAGRFELNFEASGFGLSFSRDGYDNQVTNFLHYENQGQDTNQVLLIYLKEHLNPTRQP
jgi:hypothetical protein